MSRNRIIGGGALLAVVVAAIGVATTGASATSKPTFVIGQQSSGIISLVKDSHALDGASYNVKWAVFPFGPPEVQAVSAGQVDIGTDIGDVPPINGAASDLGFKVVAALVPPSAKQAGNYLVVPKGSAIKSLKDLKGKSVGVPFGSSAHGFLLNAVKSVGLSPTSVKFVNLAPAALAAAFKGGQIDAESIWNPQAAVDVEQGGRVLLAGHPPLDPNVGFVVAATKDVTDPVRKKLLVDLLKRLGRAYAYGDTHPSVWEKDVQKETGVDAATAKVVVANGKTTIRAVSPSILKAEQALADTFLEAKQIPKKVNVGSILVNVLPASFTGFSG
ncbi:MAG: ABC transporter substrate-binding protein [Actinomycetota bacterium]